MSDKKVKITDLFKPEELTEKSDGNFKVICPSCGSDSTRYGGMTLFVESDISFCHEANKYFNLKETFALIRGYLKCIEGRESQ